MIYIILPAYNEECNIGPLLDDIAENLSGKEYRVIIIDDGSTDGTLSAISAVHGVPVEVISHPVNAGLGTALRDGINHVAAVLAGTDTIITMDADGSHRAEYLNALIESCTGDHDVIIASRYAAGGGEIGLSWLRSLCSRGASIMMSMLFSIPGARDYTSGFRCYSGEIIQRGMRIYEGALVEENGFTCMAEVLMKLSFAGAACTEIPLLLRYDMKMSSSKMPVVRTIIRYTVLWYHLLKIRSRVSKGSEINAA